MAPRLPVARPERESLISRLADLRHGGALAWGRLVYRYAPVIAGVLGVGKSITSKQGQPDSGKRAPNVSLLLAVLAALEDGADPADALAPVDWLERELGRVAIPLPRPGTSPEDLARAIGCAAREFGEAITLASGRLGDSRRPLRSETDKLVDEIQQALVKLLELQALATGEVPR